MKSFSGTSRTRKKRANRFGWVVWWWMVMARCVCYKELWAIAGNVCVCALAMPGECKCESKRCTRQACCQWLLLLLLLWRATATATRDQVEEANAVRVTKMCHRIVSSASSSHRRAFLFRFATATLRRIMIIFSFSVFVSSIFFTRRFCSAGHGNALLLFCCTESALKHTTCYTM